MSVQQFRYNAGSAEDRYAITLKRPLKEPDRVYPLAKHQEYACVYDWDDRSS
jgi:hypothetical protein